MFRLIPKEETFYVFFNEAADNLVEGAKAVSELVKDLRDVDKKVERIKDIEHKGDEITYRTIELLNRTFVTPLDREDIHALVSGIDNILDLTDQAASLFSMYKLQAPNEDIPKMCDILVKACEALKRAVHMMEDAKRFQEVIANCREIRAQEKIGDKVIQHAMQNLFDNEKDPIQIIKWKEVYEDLENALDEAQDVANVIEGILLKLS